MAWALALGPVLQAASIDLAVAQTSQWTGAGNDGGNWNNGTNWNNGVPSHNAIVVTQPGFFDPTIANAMVGLTGTLSIGTTTDPGKLTIHSSSTFGPHVNVFVGDGAAGPDHSRLLVSGSGTEIKGGSLGSIRVGEVGAVGVAGTGRLDVVGGASISGAQIFIADAVNSIGTVTVETGSNIFVPAANGAGWVSVGFAGNGTLNILSGGVVVSEVGALATTSTGVGAVTVHGSGSRWTIYGGNRDFHIGGAGTGSLQILNGGQVNAETSPIIIGRDSGSTGTVTVDGPGSSLTNTSTLTIGESGSGELLATKGGNVTTTSINIAKNSGSFGILNIGGVNGGSPQAPGTIDASAIVFGSGDGKIFFNHTSTGYFFGVPISGPGEVTAQNGTTIFTADNTYTAGTVIEPAATLQLGDGGTKGSVLGNVINDGTLIFNRSNTYEFNGTISGLGNVVQNGSGTTIFNTAQPYVGPTSINSGVLSVNSTLASSLVTVNPGGTLAGIGTILNGVNNFGNVSPGNSIGDLTVMGSYFGFGGTLTIESVLAGNSSPIDHLNLAGPAASASGVTGIVVVNLNGPGGLTTGNGIPVVIATGGATTTSSAFHLAGPVAAGPFQYLLFRGPQGTGTADEQNTWYLRSHTTGSPLVGGPGPVMGGGGGGPTGPGPEIPLYRPETATYGVFPALARDLAASTLGTFHMRNGDQALAGGSRRERMWGRIFGQRTEQSYKGDIAPGFDGYVAGFQTGVDAYETEWEKGTRARAGLFVGWAQARGDTRGFVLGQLNAAAGDAQLEATTVGSYGTLVGRGGWYVDSVLMTSFYSGSGGSRNGINTSVDGWSISSSLEAGIPFRLGYGLELEPQAQIIFQHLNLDKMVDPFSTVRFDTPDGVSGRVGVRLAGTFAGRRFRPYLKANLWQDWLDKDGVIYADTYRLDTKNGGTALELGGGLVVELSPGVGLWGAIDYTGDIAGDTDRETLRGNAGVRITW